MSESPAIHTIMLQFRFAKRKMVPFWVPEIKQLTKTALDKPADVMPSRLGTMHLQATECVDIRSIPAQLKKAGFVFNACFCQPRFEHSDVKPSYYIVRYAFWRSELAHPVNASFAPHLAKVQAGLESLCKRNYWRTRSYTNPFVERGIIVEGACALSLNLEVRVPRFGPDGKPVTCWRKDDAGKRIGEGPEPIRPRGTLKFNGSQFCLQ